MIQIGEVLGGLFADLGVDDMTAEGGAAMERAPAPGLRAESPNELKGTPTEAGASVDREVVPSSAPEEFKGRPVLRLVKGSRDLRARPKADRCPLFGARKSLVLVCDA